MTSSKDKFITLKNVSLCYKTRIGILKNFNHYALKNISFDIRRGETYGILGRNGSGKSSLLLLLADLINPTAGEIVCENNIKRSLLSLGLGFRPDLSGRDNALLSAMIQGATKKQALNYLDEIKEFSNLGDFFYQPVRTYSTGMRSRLAFSTAIKTDVDFLLIDEVLSVGDALFRKKAENALLEKIRSDQTVAFVSHSVDQIEKICDRALWLENGLIKTNGEIGFVLNQYKEFFNI